MALPRTKKRTTTVFSRDEIGVEQLQSLKDKFADGDLTEKEFVNLFREIVDASLSETQLSELFQKIDANSDGTVDWDELTNYMFLSGSGNDEYTGGNESACYETAYPERYMSDHRSGHGSTVTSTPLETMGNVIGTLNLDLLPHHKDVITRIVRLERPSVYLTTSKDGSVRTWNATSLAPQQILASGRDWITDCCVMKRSNRLAISSMDRTLSFYDLNSGQFIGDLVDYSKRQCIPLCLAYVERPSDNREAVVVGDDTGGISILACSDQWQMCDGRSPPPGPLHTSLSSHHSSNGTSGVTPGTPLVSNLFGGGSGPSTTALGSGSTSQATSTGTSSKFSLQGGNTAGSAMLEAQGFSSRVKFQKHTDWVTRVKWVNDMRAVVATSLDKTVSILDVDRLVVKFEYTRHRKGVFDLAWCASTRLIASCGMERDIHVWNPYSSQRAVATLEGHTSSVLHLVSDDENFQIVSAAADNTIKVWDVRTHRCLQTFVVRGDYAAKSARASAPVAPVSGRDGGGGSSVSSENRVAALLFDGKTPCLLTGTTQLTRWSVKSSSEFDTQGTEEGDEGLDASISSARSSRLRAGGPVKRPVRLACYNSVFHQVVTATLDAESVIKTWSAETGEEISSFAHAHGSDPVTSIAFDHAGRRLLTGSHDGEQLKMWNFSNGALVKQFNKQARPVVSSLLKTTTPATAGTVASTAPPSNGMVGGLTEPVAAVLPHRKRKPRDIMVLPASFKVDREGQGGSAGLMAQTDLPSPTRVRLERGQNHPTPVPPTTSRLQSHSEGASDRLHSRAQSGRGQSSRDRMHRSARNSNSRYGQQEVTSIMDIERTLRVGMGNFVCQRFVCCVGWDRQLVVWADKKDELEALPVHRLPPESGDEIEHGVDKPGHETHRCRRQRHTMDVLTVAYLPPAYVATAGLDGLVLLWSLNSGELVAPLHQNAGAIEVLWYAEKLEMLFAAGEHGILFCFDRSMATQGAIPLSLSSQTTKGLKPEEVCEPITVLRCDKANTHLVSGDAAGCIKVWELRIAHNHEGIELALVCTWRLGDVSPGSATASSRRVLCADIIENFTRVSEMFVLVSCADGDVSLWTLDGVKVGSFGGRHRTWQLGQPATYALSHSCCEWEWLPQRPPCGLPVDPSTMNPQESNVQDDLKRGERNAFFNDLYPSMSVFIKNCALCALNTFVSEPREHFLLEDTMPKPGEVWMSVSSYRSRTGGKHGLKKQENPEDDARNGSMPSSLQSMAIATVASATSSNRHGSLIEPSNNCQELQALAKISYLHDKIADVTGDITELMTIVKVTRTEIFYWDSLADKPLRELKVLEMSEFVRKGDWVKHRLLSHFIGRTFLENETCFRVMAIVVRSVEQTSPDLKLFALIDSEGKEHDLQPLNEAVSSVRLKVVEASGNKNLHQNASRPQYYSAHSVFQNSMEKTQMLANQSKSVQGSLAEAVTPTSATGLATRTLPLLRSREKRAMGGLLLKRSSIRNRLDPTADIRRVHNPDNIPKNFRAVLQRKCEKTSGNFRGILPGS